MSYLQFDLSLYDRITFLDLVYLPFVSQILKYGCIFTLFISKNSFSFIILVKTLSSDRLPRLNNSFLFVFVKSIFSLERQKVFLTRKKYRTHFSHWNTQYENLFLPYVIKGPYKYGLVSFLLLNFCFPEWRKAIQIHPHNDHTYSRTWKVTINDSLHIIITHCWCHLVFL